MDDLIECEPRMEKNQKKNIKKERSKIKESKIKDQRSKIKDQRLVAPTKSILHLLIYLICV